MNIGIVTPWHERGAGIVSKHYIDILKEKHEIFIYARGSAHIENKDKKWKMNNITLGKRVPGYTRDRIYIKQFFKWIDSNNIELLFFNEQKSWNILHVLKEKRSAIILGAYIDYYTEETVRLFNIYDFLICNTGKHMKAMDSHPNSIFIQWGTYPEIYENDCSVKGNGAPIFFHSCGYNPIRKGTDLLIKAFKHLDSDDAKLVIHTQNKLNFSDNRINEIINTDNRIEIITKTIPAPGLYHECDVYVYPTRLEGIGLTVPEALMSGLPCIVPDDAPMNEFVNHKKNGYLVEPERFIARKDGYYWPQVISSIKSIKEGLEYYIDNFDQLDDIKKSVYKDSRERFDWSRNASELCHIFSCQKSEEVSRSFLQELKEFDKNKMGCNNLLKHLFICIPFPLLLKSKIYNFFMEKRWKNQSG